jgi:hypothetical protein
MQINNIKDWVTPDGFHTAQRDAAHSNEPFHHNPPPPPPHDEPKTDPTPELEMPNLGGLFGDNPMAGLLLSLIKGEKLDMLSLLPFIMQMGNNKKADKPLSLDDYKV